MKLPWKRSSTTDKDVDVLMAQAHSAAPSSAVPTGPFRLVVADVFTIKNRGTVATGQIESGSVSVGQQVRVVRDGVEVTSTTVTGVEMFRKNLDTAGAGDNVGLLVGDASVQSGDVLES